MALEMIIDEPRGAPQSWNAETGSIANEMYEPRHEVRAALALLGYPPGVEEGEDLMAARSVLETVERRCDALRDRVAQFSSRNIAAESDGSGSLATRREARVQTSEPRIKLCISDDQLTHLPQGVAVKTWPAGAVLPRVGEVVYLSSTSAWVVRIVVHEFLCGGDVSTEVWIDWIGAARHRESDCTRWVQ